MELQWRCACGASNSVNTRELQPSMELLESRGQVGENWYYLLRCEKCGAPYEMLQTPEIKDAIQAQQTSVAEVQVRPASRESVFYSDWALETFKGNLAFANDVLRQLMGLSMALLGGSIAFLDTIHPTAKLFANLFFFLALIVSFWGMMPFSGKISPHVPALIREHKQAALRSKLCKLWAAGVLIGLGFIAAMIGMLLK